MHSELRLEFSVSSATQKSFKLPPTTSVFANWDTVTLTKMEFAQRSVGTISFLMLNVMTETQTQTTAAAPSAPKRLGLSVITANLIYAQVKYLLCTNSLLWKRLKIKTKVKLLSV
jgi:hypothetical protein